MNEMKRVLALLLCFVMLVGVLPVGALAAETETTAPSETVAEAQTAEAAAAAADVEAAEIETTASAEEVALAEANEPAAYSVTTDPRSAVFCSDVHGSTSDLNSTFAAIANAGEVPSLVGFVGDTCLTMSTVDSTVNSALGCDPIVVYSYAASHDTENGSDIGNEWNMSTLAYTGDYFNVYVIRETDMQNENSSAVETFNSYMASIDTTKPLFILSHRPLHERRNDNAGAAIWYDAISAAAEKIDIVFLWGHNHTGEDSVDTAAYYVEKDGSETITIEGGSSVVPNFTYMNAGYINANGQNPARKGVATTVYVKDDSLVFQDYNASGEYSGTHAHNVTVTREFAKTESTETTDPTESTEATDPVVTAPEKIEVSGTDAYTVGDTLNVTVKGYTYSTDGTTDVDIALADCKVAVSCPDGHECTLDTVMNTIATGEGGNYHQVTVTYMGVSGSFMFTVGEAADLGNSELGVGVSVNAAVTGAVTVAESTNENVAAAMETAEVTNYKAYDITTEIAMGAGNYAVVSLPIPEGVETPVVYYVSDDGKTVTDMEATDNGDGTVSFVTDHFSIYVVGAAGNEEEEDLTGTDAKVENAEVPTTEDKTVYVLVDTPSAGNQYIIVSSGTAGATGYALKENTTTGTSVTINAATDDIAAPYIDTTDKTIMWNATSGLNFQSENGGYYLNYSSSSGSYSLSFSTSSASDWTAGTNQLYRNGKSKDYWLRYNSGWTMGGSGTTYNVYFYEAQTIKVPTTTTMNGTYSIAGEPVTKVVENGSTATLSSTLTFTPESGDATTEDVSSTAAYTIYKDTAGVISGINGNTITFSGTYGSAIVMVSYTKTINGTDYTVTNYIQVTATEPTYKIEICDVDTTDPITEVIVIKGEEEMAEGYNLDQYITYVDASGESAAEKVDITNITWTSSNEGIAKVEKNSTTGHATVTFPGDEGSAQITVHYEYTDGKFATDVISVSVSKKTYVIPSDGTDDFPEYPNQGAIRIDKTATAVGNFSETGMAQVELSMTGVPYGTNVKTDVVVMVDMTASMSDDDVTAAEAAVKELIESLVYDEENDKYDPNIQLFVDVFYSASEDSSFETEEYLNNVTISSETELTAAQAKIDFTQSSSGGGTRYNLAMKDVYETLNRDGHAENQFVVFVSDGVPTAYAPASFDTDGKASLGTTLTGSNSTTESLADGWFDLTTGVVTSTFKTEYYSYMIKSAGIPVYTVGCNLTALTEPAEVLAHMSSNYSPDGKTSTGETKYSFFCTTSGGITDDVLAIFKGIGESIKEAATNVVVEDKIADEYTMTFSLPSGVTATEAGMDDFYIQVVGYELDENHDRKANPTVLEKFLFSDDGTITHTIGATTCESCTHVTKTNGVVTEIVGTYFTYTNKDGVELLTWKADKLDTTELALQYIVYLDNSAGDVPADDQIDPGTYNTNEYATITYINFNGNECHKEFPVPSMTWKGAHVKYVFYLVNEDGQPVNKAGKVVPFAEAIYVTDPVLYNVTWNDDEGIESLDAKYLAQEIVPDVYALYDQNAYYEILVYQTEGVDSETNAKNYNHFIIEGSASGTKNEEAGLTVTNLETTKVFNTKHGIRYDDYGAYSATAGSYTSRKSGTSYTATVTNSIDYANTTVAFAVVWKPELQPDTVVIDYGLDVVINVATNDALASGVVGVRATAPENVEINKGQYTSAKATTVDIRIGDDAKKIATATVESIQAVRFSLEKTTGMQFTEPASFYYESDCNYYTYDANNNANLNSTSMYSQVTVIPATTVYYEDEYVTLKSHTKQSDGTYTESVGWTVNSTAATDTQAVDRPGSNPALSEAYDANNEYGYDAAYDSSSTYSMGTAAMVTVSNNMYATAEFDFYGTGFDVISMTDTTTGFITVRVFDADGNKVQLGTIENADGTTTPVYSKPVDTYYGYTYGLYDATYYWDGYSWFLSDVKAATKSTADADLTDLTPADAGTEKTITTYLWQPDSSNEGHIYQVPVMKISGLTQGKYKAVVTASYNKYLDQNAPGDSGSYDFYLDAIRIYDPIQTGTDVGDTTVGEIYVKDGEGYPVYKELRDILIGKNDYDALTAGNQTEGAIFIDDTSNTVDSETGLYTKKYSIEDYTNFGPNNEVYLASGQTVAFELDLSSYKKDDGTSKIADVQIGMKSANGASVKATMGIDGNTTNPATITSGSSSADRYYSIGSYVDKGLEDGQDGKTILSFTNSSTTSGTLLSITNLKLTFVEQTAITAGTYNINRNAANTVLMMLNAEPEEEETPVVLPDAELEISVSGGNVKVGNKVTVKATTSEDVDYLIINGQEVTEYKLNKKTGKRTWTLTVKAEEVGDMEINVTAYNADGYELDTVTETVEVAVKNNGKVQNIVGQLLDKLFG